MLSECIYLAKAPNLRHSESKEQIQPEAASHTHNSTGNVYISFENKEMFESAIKASAPDSNPHKGGLLRNRSSMLENAGSKVCTESSQSWNPVDMANSPQKPISQR